MVVGAMHWSRDDAVLGLCLLVPCLLLGLDLAVHIVWGWILQLPAYSFSNAFCSTPTQALLTFGTIFLLQ